MSNGENKSEMRHKQAVSCQYYNGTHILAWTYWEHRAKRGMNSLCCAADRAPNLILYTAFHTIVQIYSRYLNEFQANFK